MNLRLQTLLWIFVALLVAMNLLWWKIITILSIWVSVGIFMVPLTFLITDIVEEVYGKKLSRHFIITGMISLIIIIWFMTLFVYLKPNPRYTFNEEYITIFKLSSRIIIASIVAFTLAQLHDVRHFRLIKKKKMKIASAQKQQFYNNITSYWYFCFYDDSILWNKWKIHF